VYRAKNLVTGEIVALKKIQIFDMVDAKARQDCIKEIDLLKVRGEGSGLLNVKTKQISLPPSLPPSLSISMNPAIEPP
jgi:hypothetical protein